MNPDANVLTWRAASSRRSLHASRAPPTHGDLAVFHDDRHRSLAVAESQHTIQVLGRGFDVDKVGLDPFFCEILTGSRCVGSAVFAVNRYATHVANYSRSSARVPRLSAIDLRTRSPCRHEFLRGATVSVF